MAGSHYHISLTQLLECEKKLRIQSSVKLELLVNSIIVPLSNFDFQDPDVPAENGNEIDIKNLPSVNIDNAKIENVAPYLPVITYLGGYCSHAVIKKLKCLYCKENLVLDSEVNLDEHYNLIKNLDHGGLKCPTQYVVTVVLFNYITVNTLYTECDYFIKLNNQKLAVVSSTFDALQSKEISLNSECPNGHDDEFICKLLLSAFTNIMLKNICIKQNETVIKMKEEKKSCKKRKLETLQK